MRVFSGTLKKDSTVAVVGVRKPVKLGALLDVQAEETSPIDEVGPGGIVAVAKVEDLHTGSSLGELTLPPIPFPTPMVGLAATPKSRGDEGKLSGALHKICEEDSTFHRDLDAQTKEMVITGMSELHLQVLRERLKRRDKVEVETREPEDSVPRDDPGQRRGHVPPQEADRRPRAVRRGPYPHVPHAQGRERRGVGQQMPASPR